MLLREVRQCADDRVQSVIEFDCGNCFTARRQPFASSLSAENMRQTPLVSPVAQTMKYAVTTLELAATSTAEMLSMPNRSFLRASCYEALICDKALSNGTTSLCGIIPSMRLLATGTATIIQSNANSYQKHMRKCHNDNSRIDYFW